MHSALVSRTISGFPVSVGTALAFESLFTPQLQPIDSDRIIPQKVNITDYQTFWINLRTLFRNLFGSVMKEESSKILPHDWAEVMTQEIEFIQELISLESLSQTRVFFYFCTHNDLILSDNKFDIEQLRKDNTISQKAYTSLELDTIAIVLSKFKDRDNFLKFSSALKPKTRVSAIIMTHVAYDLLSYGNFTKLDLLESHTGVLKPKHMWYTKYQSGKELTMMPFYKPLLKIFGDSQTYKPMDIRLRRTIIELATEKHWTPVTTIAKVKSDLMDLKQSYYQEVVRNLF